MNDLYIFGPFRLDEAQGCLFRSDRLVRLTANEYQLLLLLVKHAGQTLDPEFLVREVWPKTHVGSGSLRAAVSHVRSKLSEGGDDTVYIRNFPNQGYRFAAIVQIVPPFPTPTAPPSGGVAGQVSGGDARQAPARHSRSVVAVCLCAGMLTFGGLFWVSRPMAAFSTQITNDGRRKAGPVLIDGDRLYFLEPTESDWRVVSVPIGGGTIVPAPLNLPSVRLLDVNAHHEFLVSGLNDRQEPQLWKWKLGEPPVTLIGVPYGAAGWVNDTDVVLADGPEDELRLVTQKSASVLGRYPGRIRSPKWSPVRQLLRLSVIDPRTDTRSIWQSRGLGGAAEFLADFPPDACCGVWSGNGSRFVFTAAGETVHDIWISEEPLGPLWRPHPRRLTQGGIDYQDPALNEKGTVAYAIGKKERGRLLRFDLPSRQFIGYLDDLNALEVDFSPRGDWMAYVSFPERILWKARSDGSERTALTLAPLAAIEPHWSPDGRRIAFMGQHSRGPRRLYMVSVDGGAPAPVTTFPEDQGVPTWSPDGQSLLFGEIRQQKSPRDMTIHVLDLLQSAVTMLPASNGLWTARWSPDGKRVVALTEDNRQAVVYEVANKQWQELAAFDEIENPTWSKDSSFVYVKARNHAGSIHGWGDPAIYRINVVTHVPEKVVDLKGLQLTYPAWTGLCPDGSPLISTLTSSEELYELSLRPRKAL